MRKITIINRLFSTIKDTTTKEAINDITDVKINSEAKINSEEKSPAKVI